MMRPHDADPSEYDQWARYYDLTDSDRAPFIAFYSSLIDASTRSVLDLGCGTGSITIELADHVRRVSDAGVRARVVGIDRSGEMLSIARARRPGIAWIAGDMRLPPVAGTFDLVICCFNTLQLLVTDDAMERALRGVRHLLGRRGVFAFDIYQPNTNYLNAPYTDRVTRRVTDVAGKRLEIREAAHYDQKTRVLTVDWRLLESDRSAGEPLARARFCLRQYFSQDVERLLNNAGFIIRERYGDFDRSSFDPNSRKQILVCGPA